MAITAKLTRMEWVSSGMSSVHSTDHQSNGEHGTVMSYTIGFILSLVFTVVPYYLVVSKSVSGNALLATILGFAVAQMIIQILFFLHLGRGPKPLYNIAFFVSTVGIILVVVGGSLFIMRHLHYNMAPTEVSRSVAEKEGIYQVEGKKTGACQEIGANHKVIIGNGAISPRQIKTSLCDTLTFISQDDILHEIAFGLHPNHETYAGEGDLHLRTGRNKTITLNQSGTYQFHDHVNPELTGDFTVKP